MLGIHEKHRKKGIGTLLLTQFLQESEKRLIKSIYLEVTASNKNAIEFYKTHHFTIIDHVPSFYQNGDDALIMQWTSFQS